jgi:hypothetical protein
MGPTRATEYRKVPPQSCTSPTATALHHACRRMLPSAAPHHGVSWPRPPSATDRHQVHTPPLPTRSTASGTEWHREASEQHQVSTFALSGAQFSSATEHHRVPLCAALRAMPTNADLTLICAGALQEPSQPILRCAKTATQANAGRRAPPNATECHKGTHLRATERHRAVSPRDAACRLPPATAFHRVPLSATVRCKAPPSATMRATARHRVLPSAAERQMPPTDMSTTARQQAARCIRSATACHHKAARHRLPLRGTARATGGCRASLRAMESRVECHRVPPIAM